MKAYDYHVDRPNKQADGELFWKLVASQKNVKYLGLAADLTRAQQRFSFEKADKVITVERDPVAYKKFSAQRTTLHPKIRDKVTILKSDIYTLDPHVPEQSTVIEDDSMSIWSIDSYLRSQDMITKFAGDHCAVAVTKIQRGSNTKEMGAVCRKAFRTLLSSDFHVIHWQGKYRSDNKRLIRGTERQSGLYMVTDYFLLQRTVSTSMWSSELVEEAVRDRKAMSYERRNISSD